MRSKTISTLRKRGPKHFRFMLTAFVAIYAIIGLYLGTFQKPEVFPFFSWSLFSQILKVKTDFALDIHEFDGQLFETPRDFMASDDLFKGSRNISAYYTIQELGHSCLASVQTQGRFFKKECEKGKKLLEQVYLKNFKNSLGYEPIQRIYDPMKFWRYKKFTKRSFMKIVRLEK